VTVIRYALRCGVDGCINDTDGFSTCCSSCWGNRLLIRVQLPGLWLRLHGQLPRGAAGLSEGVSRPRPGSRPPLQVHILDALSAVVRRLVGWADACLGMEGPLETEHRRQGVILLDAMVALDRHDEALRTSSAACRYVMALGQMHRQMTLLVGLEPSRTRLPMPCPACDQKFVPLYRDSERQCVTCTLCSHVAPDAVWIGRLLNDAARSST
jgi:hypothetical protein